MLRMPPDSKFSRAAILPTLLFSLAINSSFATSENVSWSGKLVPSHFSSFSIVSGKLLATTGLSTLLKSISNIGKTKDISTNNKSGATSRKAFARRPLSALRRLSLRGMPSTVRILVKRTTSRAINFSSMY